MREKFLEIKILYWLIGAVIFVVILCGFFLSTNIIALSLFEKFITRQKTAYETTKETDIDLLSRALTYQPGNAEYSASKADMLLAFSAQQRDGGFPAKNDEIEALYKKAISLNPINWEYHLKLGYYYAQKQDVRAEKELLRSAQLSWKNFKPHQYITQYYIQEQNYQKAFYHMILFLAYANQWERARDYFRLLPDNLAIKAEVHAKGKDMSIHFLFYPNASAFSLQAQGFPYEKVPFTIIVYLNKPLTTVTLYKNNTAYADFRWIGERENTNMYQLHLSTSASEPCLNELSIQTKSGALIEKIVFIRQYASGF